MAENNVDGAIDSIEFAALGLPISFAIGCDKRKSVTVSKKPRIPKNEKAVFTTSLLLFSSSSNEHTITCSPSLILITFLM